MKAIIFTITALMFIGLGAYSQTTYTFEGNNFRWKQSTSGILFYDQGNGLNGMEIPVGEGNHPVFSSSLWLGGLRSDGTVAAAFQLFCQVPDDEKCDAYGPLQIGSAITNPTVTESFNKIWFVTKAEIDAHIAYFDCLNNPSCNESLEFPNGYNTPDDFFDWPAHGDVDQGYAAVLAPFFDRNANGNYEPLLGDHPVICGDFSSFHIRNDYGTNQPAFYESMGLEIHTQVYGYTLDEPAFQNTLFVKHTIFNRSTNSYSNSYVGTFTDYDLGNPYDDYLQVDVSRSMHFVYNDAFDEESGSGSGYGADLPTCGVRYLRGVKSDSNGIDDTAPVTYTPYANFTTGWADEIIDNEYLGMSYAWMPGGGSGIGVPASPNNQYRYLRGLNALGNPFHHGSILFEDNGEPISRYIFPGNSDPLLFGTNGIQPVFDHPDGWTEITTGYPSGDRRMLASSGPVTFAPGDVQTIDYAFIFARESHDPNNDVFTTLRQYADAVVGMECGDLPSIVTGLIDREETLEFQVFPNPNSGNFSIQLPSTAQRVRIEIYDPSGRKLKDISGQNRLNYSMDINLSPGLYFVRVSSDRSAGVKKVVVR